MNETRKNPSPPGPKSEPGRTTTPSSCSRRSPNTALGMFLGSGHHRYMVAFGLVTGNPADENASTAASRRLLNSATFVGIQSTHSSSAVAAAAWIAMNVPVSMKDFTFASAPMNSAFPHAQPQRQPVMLYVFDIEWNSIATSRAPGISKMLGGTYP